MLVRLVVLPLAVAAVAAEGLLVQLALPVQLVLLAQLALPVLPVLAVLPVQLVLLVRQEPRVTA